MNHRTTGAAIEPRGVLAEWRAGSLTLWTSTQIPHLVRLFLAGELGLSEERIRVVAPEVGGGFGSKLNHLRRGGARLRAVASSCSVR